MMIIIIITIYTHACTSMSASLSGFAGSCRMSKLTYKLRATLTYNLYLWASFAGFDLPQGDVVLPHLLHEALAALHQ